MFSKESVPISENMLKESSLAVNISRIFGLFPFSVYRIKTQRFLQWSHVYGIYSFVLGAILVILSYAGLLDDILDTEKSIRIKSHTEVYVMLCDISVVEFVIIFCIFVHPLKYNAFYGYLKCVNEVDLLIKNDTVLTTTNKYLWMFIGTVVTTICMLTADVLMYTKLENKQDGKPILLRRYLAFYITYILLSIYHYQFWYLGYSILKRLKKLNAHLEMKNINNIRSFIDNKCLSKSLSQINVETKSINYVIDKLINKKDELRVLSVHSKSNRGDDNEIVKDKSALVLTSAYIHLCDAVDYLNQLLGVTNAIVIVGILWHLIESLFHLLIEVGGTRKNIPYIAMTTAWTFYHLARLIMTVEPCHSCTVEVQKMQNYACKLLYATKESDELRIELDVFATTLVQCKSEFTAAGLTKIDRSLVTALLGTITTYLVILLQFQNN